MGHDRRTESGSKAGGLKKVGRFGDSRGRWTEAGNEVKKRESPARLSRETWHVCHLRKKLVFIRPSSDGTYYGMMMSFRPSAHFLHFSHTCFDIMSWNFAHDFVLMYYRSSLSVVTLRQFLYARRDVLWYGDVRLSVRPSGSPSARFPHFSPTCFDILSWNFAHDFVLMYYRSSLSVVNLRQVLLELCPFWNLEYWKYTVFRTFLLHALTYWVEILHMTLFYCTTDQVRVSSICVNFCGSYAPFGT